MANKKLLQDLQSLATIRDLDRDWIRDVAGRALEEIEYLEDQIGSMAAELAGDDI